VFALLTLALLAPTDTTDGKIAESSTSAELAVHGGGSVGNLLLVPFAVPGLSLSLEGSQKLTFFETFFLRADALLAVGYNINGDAVSFAGYGAKAAAGLRIQPANFFVWEPELHGGITSIAYFPIPLVGIGSKATFLFPIDENIRFDLQLKADVDFLVIVPAPSGSASVGFRWRAGPFQQTTRVGMEGDAILAALANSLSGGFFIGVNAELLF